MVLHISNLEYNSFIYKLDSFNQEKVKGGFFGKNISECDGTTISLIDRLSITHNGELIYNLARRPLNFTSICKKFNLNKDYTNQVLTSGNSNVIIDGQKF